MSDASEKATSQRVNLNTWLSIGGFALMIISGSITVGNFQAETEAAREELTRKVSEIKAQQATDIGRIDARAQTLEAAINTLNIRDARNDERMNSILETLRRIDAKLTAQEMRNNGGKP